MKKRVFSMILAMLMLCSLLPLTAIADESTDCIRSNELIDGDQVIFYNPGHGMAISNVNVNDWYLQPQALTPADGVITEYPDSVLWTAVDNGDGTWSFTDGGSKAMAAYPSGTYVELTSDPTVANADSKWTVSFDESGLCYIKSATVENSYGPAYIECYYNANKDQTTVTGYTSSNPMNKPDDFGFELYILGACSHEWTPTSEVKATCTEEGSITYTCENCGKTKTEAVPATGHNYVNGVCTLCGAETPGYVRTECVCDGLQVVLYNPGHGMAIANENDNDWYLIPQPVTPEGNIIHNPDDAIVYTVKKNANGTWSFWQGEDTVAAYANATFADMTNDPNHAGADNEWILTLHDGLFYFQSASIVYDYGVAYIECYYNSSRDKTYISGYASSNPLNKPTDFGFEVYALGGSEHNWVEEETVAPACLDDGYTLYTCTKCGMSEQRDIVPGGHADEDKDGYCDVCGAYLADSAFIAATGGELHDGDLVVIYNPGHGMAVTNETDNNWYLVPEEVTPQDNIIDSPEDYMIWTVVENEDGTYSFVCGDNAIVAWQNGTYIELTNNADYPGGDDEWIVTYKDGYYYIQSASLSNSYGPAYIECYYNANKDRTNISGYTSANPSNKPNDFGFVFYILGGESDPHVWDEGKTLKDATCTEKGSILYTCTECGETKTVEIPALGHDTVKLEAVPATCTEPGLTAGEYCTRCDYKVAQKEIPALGHDLVIDEAVEPTCEEPGFTEGFHCTRCDYGVAQTEIPATGHNFENGTCTNCGAEETHCPCWDYTDVDRGSWYHSAADFVIERGIMGSTKTDALTFEPSTACTRSMIVSILYRLSGSPEVEYEAKFPDVPANRWYTDAVIWAAQNGIVKGYDTGLFGPNDKITREQMAVILMTYAQYCGKETTQTADLSVFPDGSKATWSKAYVEWAVGAGMISGKTNNGKTLLDPQGNATRAEVASILMRFIQNIIE